MASDSLTHCKVTPLSAFVTNENSVERHFEAIHIPYSSSDFQVFNFFFFAMPHGSWDLVPLPGTEPLAPQQGQRGVLTTGHQGNPLNLFLSSTPLYFTRPFPHPSTPTLFTQLGFLLSKPEGSLF